MSSCFMLSVKKFKYFQHSLMTSQVSVSFTHLNRNGNVVMFIVGICTTFVFLI